MRSFRLISRRNKEGSAVSLFFSPKFGQSLCASRDSFIWRGLYVDDGVLGRQQQYSCPAIQICAMDAV